MKILLVEDDQSLADTIIDYLQLNDFVVAHHNKVVDAVKAIVEEVPDVVVCDINLPDGSGFDVLECLKNNNLIDFTGFIFLSALANKEDVRKGMNTGADDYIQKPFDFNDLIATIHGVNHKITSRKKRFEELNQQLEEQQEKINKALDINSHELRARVVKISNILRLVNDGYLDKEKAFGWLQKSSSYLDSTFFKINDILSDYENKISQNRARLHHVRHVWSIDDDIIQLKIFESMIKHHLVDTKFLAFHNPYNALEHLEEGNVPDLILLDIRMPEMSGFEFLEQLKLKRFNCPVIMVSSSINGDDMARSLAHPNVIGYEVKPLRPTALKEISAGI